MAELPSAHRSKLEFDKARRKRRVDSDQFLSWQQNSAGASGDVDGRQCPQVVAPVVSAIGSRDPRRCRPGSSIMRTPFYDVAPSSEIVDRGGHDGMVDANPFIRLPAEVKTRLRKRPQPEWIAPMLATLTDERFSREGWLFEPKWDGERCLAFRRGRNLSLFSRNRILLNDRYPEITTALHQQKTAFFIVDGEIVTFKNGVTSFARHRRLHRAAWEPGRFRSIAAGLLPRPKTRLCRQGRDRL